MICQNRWTKPNVTFAMRAMDDPQATYRRQLEALLSKRPELADVKPAPTFVFVPDPRYGIGPPATADLCQIPANGQ